MNLLPTMDLLHIVYAIAVTSVLSLFWLILLSVGQFRKNQVARVVYEEDGAAYTLSYVMVIPVYTLVMCMVIETAAFLPAKMGTVYASFAAARTASVWSSATGWETAEKKAIAAARRAFVPFASSTQDVEIDNPSDEAKSYVVAHQQFAEVPVKENYLLRKFAFAQTAVKVAVSRPQKWNDEITATVAYEFPFNVPGVARILGQQRDDGSYYLPIQSTVVLQNEAPQADDSTTGTSTIGIGYGTQE